MKIAIGCDHIGIELKPTIVEFLESTGHSVQDFGTMSNERVNYPDFAQTVSESVVSKDCDLGVLICGTGVGISIAANKMNGVRAVVCSEPYSAKLSREHNNTNILALGSRVIGPELAKMITKEWLDAEFEGGRHQKRVSQIAQLEKI